MPSPTQVFSIYQPYTFSTFVGNGPGSINEPPSAARFDGPYGTAVDHAGNVYVADANNNIIRKITPGGVVSTLAGLAGMEGSDNGSASVARFFGPKGVAVGVLGNVYVADSGNHTIRKITPEGEVSTLAGMAGIPGCTDGVGAAARFHFPTGIAVDANGNLYVTDNVNNTIRMITPDGTVTTLAGTPGVPGSDNGIGAAALFSGPFALAVDSGGILYVADSRNHIIRKIENDPDRTVSTLAGLVGLPGSADSPAPPQFDAPLGITVDGGGNVFVADSFNQTIRKITPEGVVSTLAGTANEDVSGGGSANGVGAEAEFNRPIGIAVNSADILYVGDSHNDTIRKITPDGTVTTFAGVSGLGTLDGMGSAARFEFPNGIALDAAGNVYVADVANDTIRKITPDGTVTTLAGTPTVPGYVNGNGSEAQFNLPRGVAVDSTGNVYVSDRLNQAIRKITPKGDVTTLVGPPQPAPGATPPLCDPTDPSGLCEPFGIAVDKSGNVFVADSGNFAIRKVTPAGAVSTVTTNLNHKMPSGMTIDNAGILYVTASDSTGDAIFKVTPTGVVTTVAGNGRGSFDGPASFAQFRNPTGVAVDGAGNIYVGDSGNDTVRKIGTDGLVTTVGGFVGRKGGADGTGRAARFSFPRGVAVDSLGKLYVADNVNNTIRTGLAAAPVITSPTTASGTVGLEFTYQFAADGTTSITIGKLPAGLTPDYTHSAIVGTPKEAGTFSVPLSASNSAGTTRSTLMITIQPASDTEMNVFSGSGLTGRSGMPFTYRVKGSDLGSSATITADGLPPGLTIDRHGLISGILSNQVLTDPATGVVTTAPVADGSSAVKLKFTKGKATTESTLQLTFSSDPALPVIISPTRANVVDGQPFSYAIATPTPEPSATPDPTAGVTTYAISGTLPLGLKFDAATGTISGIYNQQAAEKGSTSSQKGLSGGGPANVVGSVQMFAKNKRGTATIPLLFIKAPPRADNLSSRVPVGTKDNVLIGGFIISGNAPGKVLVRGLGPSLSVDGVLLKGTLQDPALEIRNSLGALVVANDNWGSSCEAPDIFATGLAPADPREPAVLQTLTPGNYTTILHGSNVNSTGIGLVEVYDLGTESLDVTSESELANISTRGMVEAGDAIMIGGFIIGGNTASNVLVRALGPSLASQQVAGVLSDPVLELHDGNGSLIASNDDWTSDQEVEILFTNLAPTNPHESAILKSLNPGTYSAIVAGKNGVGGVALVEVYILP